MIGIVILNYNTWNETIQCIQSIDKHYTQQEVKVYVVDNMSPQKPCSDQSEFFNVRKDITLINATANKGYSAGNNLGIKAALEDKCDYIVVSNSDILFVDRTLVTMQAFFETNESTGIIGPHVYDTQNQFQSFHMLTKLTAWGKIKNMCLHTPFGFLFKKFKNEFICDHQLDKPLKVFGVSGCCFMMSRDCAEYLYPLDERTFLYEEEYIIGAILENSKYSVFVIPNTYVIHAQGVSTGKISKFSYNCLIESEQLYLKEYLHTNIVMRYVIFALRKLLLNIYRK